MRVSVDQKIIEKIARYLVTKPYQEVAQLISELQTDMKPIKEEAETDQKPTPKVVPMK